MQIKCLVTNYDDSLTLLVTVTSIRHKYFTRIKCQMSTSICNAPPTNRPMAHNNTERQYVVSVAKERAKQKCFQATFEHFGRARCGLQVISRQPIPSSRSSDWKSPNAKSTVGAWNNVVAVRGGAQCSQWRNVPCSREHVSNVCRRPTNGWLVDQQTPLVINSLGDRQPMRLSQSWCHVVAVEIKDKTRRSAQHSLKRCKCWGRKTC